ncbi:BamA/TamA family outer membrane protein [Bacteroidales bacterium OttesenSCG-928-B11]|nr:BamA/TamA family outer membrane protein [Bacteroidales bacterium OttesenSCG-928-B11]
MKKLLLISLILCAFTLGLRANDTITLAQISNDIQKEKPKTEKPKKEKESVRTGWTFGVLPSIAYDSDLGLQLGALTNIYFFGDGSTYPEYLHSLYLELAYTTKRYGLFRFSYDSKYLIPKHRLTVDISYLPDAMSDFFGFNGYQSVYNPEWKTQGDPNYISRAFYKYRRDIFRVSGDLQGKIGGNWNWNAGLGLLVYNIGSVNIDMINKGKKDEDKLPDVDGLYEKYQKWGLIGENEDGGWHPYIRAGITYDSRDKQQNPTKGIYADVFLTYTAAFGDQSKFNNLKTNFTFRHYVPIYKDWISFAYRAAVQLSAAGETPFYLNNYWNTLYIQRVLYEALGGANTLRGIQRNKVAANGFAFANVEFRFKVAKFKIKKENFYIGLVPFLDAGMILQPYDISEEVLISNIKENDPDFDLAQLPEYIDFSTNKIYTPHISAGLGLKIAMNENFVLSVDWAAPFNKQDNNKMSNLYIKMGYMF